MSDSQRIEGNRVYCHVCEHEWDRAIGGLQCPACESEFVEIIESNTRSRPDSPPPIPPHPRSLQSPRSPNPLYGHNPWAPDPEEDDITTFEFNTGGGRGTFSFTSRTYTIGGGSMRGNRDQAVEDINQNFQTMLNNIMGLHQRRTTGHPFDFPPHQQHREFGAAHPGGPPPDLFSMLFPNVGERPSNQPPSPFAGLLGALFNPANAQRGDTVFSQEAFDRVMTQLMEQNTSNAPGPASETAISALRKKPVDKEMMGSEGKAECSICMDNLALGDEVTVLPCNHWFHGDCVISWLREHDTCPHCRSPISNAENTNRSNNNNATTPPSSSSRRRSSRRSSGNTGSDGNRRTGVPPMDESTGVREARQRYYGSPRSSDHNTDRPPRERRSSDRSHRSNDSGNGGVTSWIRNRLPFS